MVRLIYLNEINDPKQRMQMKIGHLRGSVCFVGFVFLLISKRFRHPPPKAGIGSSIER